MGTAGQSITLANSIIGVGILAMPFCFQQCGYILATVILLFMGLISRLCCYFLLKAAHLARKRNFEFLAFQVFGPAGKLAVELGIIGFLMGTCIAYFVVVGDLGPQIIAKLFNINQSDILRTSIMVLVSLLCVLPLGLLRNVDSLSNVSAATIGFYFCLVIKVIAEAASQILAGEWYSKVEMWKPSGVMQCVPIFSMALFCQTQLFEIFESLPTLSLDKMNVVTKNAINICTCVYFTLGLFGYIAFCSHTISGNILMSLSPTMASDVIKLGFVMSLAFSFPLIIFPCRASLYSFLYRKVSSHDHIVTHSIPSRCFRALTVGIVGSALCVSLLVPNIELVLGLLGSTIGVLICVVFPAACFVNVTVKMNNERVLAKCVVVLGVGIMVLGTLANLQAAETGGARRGDPDITPEAIDQIVQDYFQKHDLKQISKNEIAHEDAALVEPVKDSLIQPPNPVPPVSNEKPAENTKLEEKMDIPNVDKVVQLSEDKFNSKMDNHPKNTNGRKVANGKKKLSEKIETKEKSKDTIKAEPTVDKTQENIVLEKQQELIDTIKQHGEEQKELIKEQKKILNELIKTKNELAQEKKEIERVEAKKIAVESIQKIANVALQSLNDVTEKPGEKLNDKNEPLQQIANEIAQKAVEAIEEIKDKNQENKDVVKPDPVQSGQNNDRKASISNFAPINPPAQKIIINPEQPRAETLVQNSIKNPQNGQESNNVQPAKPILNQIVDNAKGNNNIVNSPLQDSQQIQQNQINQLGSQVIQQMNQDKDLENQPDAQQHQVKQQKREAENQIDIQNNEYNNKNENIDINQNKLADQNKNDDTNQKKLHSHSPDEPQSYKHGEDVQKQIDLTNHVAQNIPIPIAKSKELQANLNPVQVQENNGANIANLDSNTGSIRQKREALDCTQTVTLKSEDREICKILSANKQDTNQVNNKEKILTNVDLAEIGLNNIPVDMIHHGRSLKSVDDIEKKR